MRDPVRTVRAVLIAATIIVSLTFVFLVVGCGAASDVEQAKRECDRGGGTFIAKSGREWECVYDRSNR